MKKYIFLVIIVSLLNACKEDGPFIDFTPPKVKVQGDTDYVSSTLATPQLHNVLLEDFTGVKCQNCPAAHDVASTISAANPGRVVVSALHAWYQTQFTNPIPGDYPDFRDSASDYIMIQLLDNPNGLPNGSVNRKHFNLEPKRYIFYTKWTSYVNQELALSTPINIEITNVYNATTRELTAVVKMECTADVSDDVFLSVGITENKIIGKQLFPLPAGTNTAYEHNHVLRKMLTSNNGIKINSSAIKLDAKKVVIRAFKYTLPLTWDVNNCNVISILNNSTTDVIQCAEKKIM